MGATVAGVLIVIAVFEGGIRKEFRGGFRRAGGMSWLAA